MVRNPLFRRLLVATLMILGLFAQFQMVFACELMDGKAKPVCCCDKPGDMAKGCALGGGCQDQAGPVSSIAPESHTQQVLLLDAPQPPPIPATFILPDFATSRSSLRFNYPRSLPVTGTHIYLLTNRFRI